MDNKTAYTWERGRGIKLRKAKVADVETARLEIKGTELEKQLPLYWKQVQDILTRVTKQVHESEARTRFREVFLELATQPGFSVDVRKAFHKNLDSVSCELQKVFSSEDAAVLQGFMLALVFWQVRRSWMETYEILNIFPDRVEISYSGVPHAV